jgi:hypothetical protein
LPWESGIERWMRNWIGTKLIELTTNLLPLGFADVTGLALERVLVSRPVLGSLRDQVLAEFVRPMQEVNLREPEPAQKGHERLVELSLGDVLKKGGECVVEHSTPRASSP